MVEITINKNKLEQIIAMEVKGHAGYADHGQDIVCAAVSVLTINTVNSISHLLGVELQPESDAGILKCQFPVQADMAIHEKMQMLLQSMLLGLQAIEDNYKEFIRYDIIYV
jgi:uncharacterized protein YsxB (DUF464 family)